MKTVEDFLKTAKERKLTMLTAYDYQMARILEESGVDTLLVGDSLGMVFQGQDSTRPVTLEQMAYHVAAVHRGAPSTLVIGDMPYKTYENPQMAVESARKLIEAGADTVKLEGYKEGIIEAIVKAGIPVMAHLGLLPQTAESFKVQGKEVSQADLMISHALAVEKEGAYGLVLECVPEMLAKKISETLSIPTIGIGAGVYCGGQVLVINDMLGMGDRKAPKFLKKYAELNQTISTAVKSYVKDVCNKDYPSDEYTYH